MEVFGDNESINLGMQITKLVGEFIKGGNMFGNTNAFPLSNWARINTVAKFAILQFPHAGAQKERTPTAS